MNIKLDAGVKTLLQTIAHMERVSLSEIVRRAIDGYLIELQGQLERRSAESMVQRLEAFSGVRTVRKRNDD